MGEQDPDFPDPAAEAGWIAQATRAQVVMVPEAGHYPQSQRPDITTAAGLDFLETRGAGDRTWTDVLAASHSAITVTGERGYSLRDCARRA